ncbi:MAG: ROK family protein, partial [Planctomycetota bacterium]
VEGRFGKPTVLQNDANAAAYGEYWSGAGRDAESLVLWTLGTGIGCGIILRDAVIEGEHSHGSECGHIVIDYGKDARVHPGTGMKGTLEAYCGARGVIVRTQDALAVHAGRSLLKERVAAGERITPKLVCEAAAAGDELATELLTDTARLLGVGTVSVLHTIDPDCVLLAGAMTFGGAGTATGELFLETLRDEVKARAFPTVAERLDVSFASLGSDAGVVGAAGCARRAFAA